MEYSTEKSFNHPTMLSKDVFAPPQLSSNLHKLKSFEKTGFVEPNLKVLNRFMPTSIPACFDNS